MKKITVSILTTLLMLSMVFSSSVFAANEETSAWDSFLGLFSAKTTATTAVGVEYRGHIQNVGNYPLDGSWIQGPTRLGTVGQSLRLEGFWIQLTNKPADVNIEYEVHVQNVGWMAPVDNGDFAGTEGKSQQIEAIKIRLVKDNGDAVTDYSVNYRGHVQNIGDTAWYTNGQQLGTDGQFLRLEALDVEIVKNPADLTAYNAALAAVEEADYTAASWATYEAIVAANPAATTDLQSEVDAATAAIVAAQANLELEPVVTAVAATNSKTLTVTGKALFNLAATDITVADNTVVSFVGSADGTTGTVVLGSELVVDEVTNVTIKGTVYPVTYKIEFSSLVVVPATYDDDTSNQYVAITIDGQPVTGQELTNAGYTVNYTGYTSTAATTAVQVNDLFDGGAATSATGLLNNALDGSSLSPIPTAGTNVYVRVVATKGSDVYTSELGKILIKNTNLATDSITGSTLTNNTLGGDQNSRTLVTADTAQYKDITVLVGASSETVTTGFTVASSNSAVVSVDSTGLITAQGPGTATITISYGSATRTETFTVTNTARKATKVSAAPATATVAVGAIQSVKVFLLDQYGDPMAATITLENSTPAVATTVDPADHVTPMNTVTTVADMNTTVTYEFLGAAAGSTTVTYRDAASVKIGTTTTKCTVVANDTLSKYTMTVDTSLSATELGNISTIVGSTVTADMVSTDTNLDRLSDSYVKINLAGLNSTGAVVSNQQVAGTTGDYVVTVAQSAADVLDITTITPGVAGTMAQDGYVLVKAGTATGTATITVTNALTSTIVKSMTVTVTEVGYNVTSVAWKAIAAPTYDMTLTYKDALTNTQGSNDPVISGLTLSKASSQPVRMSLTAGQINTAGDATIIGSLYIDKNANGAFDLTDVLVGALQMTTTGTIANAPVVDVVAGIATTVGDNGSILYKVVDNIGNVVSVKEVVVNY